MTTLDLKSEKREIFGKKIGALRKKGLIPAVVYGGKNTAIPLILELKDFKKVFKNAGETTLVRLFVDEEKFSAKGRPADWKNVLIYDTSRDPVTDEFRHVDFYEVKMDEKITAKVPVIFVGKAPAAVDFGGVLVKAMQEIQIKALPSNLPHQIEVDISGLKTFDDHITIKDIKFSANIEVLENVSASVASVVPPRSEVELESLSEKVEEKIEDVAVETDERAAERIRETEEAVK